MTWPSEPIRSGRVSIGVLARRSAARRAEGRAGPSRRPRGGQGRPVRHRPRPRSDGELVEIQTGSFAPLGPKLDALLDDHRVRIVHPVRGRAADRARRRRRRRPLGAALAAARRRGQRVRRPRLVPVGARPPEPRGRGAALPRGPRPAARPRSDCAAAPATPASGGWWRSLDRVELCSPRDALALLPVESLGEAFSTRELAECAGAPVKLVQRAVYCLRLMELARTRRPAARAPPLHRLVPVDLVRADEQADGRPRRSDRTCVRSARWLARKQPQPPGSMSSGRMAADERVVDAGRGRGSRRRGRRRRATCAGRPRRRRGARCCSRSRARRARPRSCAAPRSPPRRRRRRPARAPRAARPRRTTGARGSPAGGGGAPRTGGTRRARGRGSGGWLGPSRATCGWLHCASWMTAGASAAVSYGQTSWKRSVLSNARLSSDSWTWHSTSSSARAAGPDRLADAAHPVPGAPRRGEVAPRRDDPRGVAADLLHVDERDAARSSPRASSSSASLSTVTATMTSSSASIPARTNGSTRRTKSSRPS